MFVVLLLKINTLPRLDGAERLKSIIFPATLLKLLSQTIFIFSFLCQKQLLRTQILLCQSANEKELV